MALTPRQVRLYTHRCHIYRPDTTVATGDAGGPAYALLASNVACYFQTDTSLDQPRIYGRDEHDILFTLDEIHMDRDQDVQSEDVLVNVTLDGLDGAQTEHYGKAWVVRGKPRAISHQGARRAGKKQIYASQLRGLPSGVSV